MVASRTPPGRRAERGSNGGSGVLEKEVLSSGAGSRGREGWSVLLWLLADYSRSSRVAGMPDQTAGRQLFQPDQHGRVAPA